MSTAVIPDALPVLTAFWPSTSASKCVSRTRSNLAHQESHSRRTFSFAQDCRSAVTASSVSPRSLSLAAKSVAAASKRSCTALSFASAVGQAAAAVMSSTRLARASQPAGARRPVRRPSVSACTWSRDRSSSGPPTGGASGAAASSFLSRKTNKLRHVWSVDGDFSSSSATKPLPSVSVFCFLPVASPSASRWTKCSSARAAAVAICWPRPRFSQPEAIWGTDLTTWR
mmetsp:Transcript_79381/g.143263  ORF Transcript_79381/g.143263 Transcript_79381/m.143263 type:complete len:228 (+) Transcript_79381:98-781(+)